MLRHRGYNKGQQDWFAINSGVKVEIYFNYTII